MRCRRTREEALEQGIEQGIEQGMDRLGALVGRLIDAGRLDDAKRASEDADYREALLAEFGLQNREGSCRAPFQGNLWGRALLGLET